MLIGLCGYPKAGKSEARKILVEQLGYHLVDTKIALRHLAGYVASALPSVFETQEGKEATYYGAKGRVIMGELGNAIEKIFGDNFMLEKTLEAYQDTMFEDADLVVDALRKDQTRHFPGIVIQIVSNRAEEPKSDYDRFYQGRTDYIVVNDGTLEELAAKLTLIVQNYSNGY